MSGVALPADPAPDPRGGTYGHFSCEALFFSGVLVGGMERDNEILTSREAQKLLRIGRTKLWALTKSGHLPAYRIGEGRTSALRYKKEELMHWLENNRIVLKKDRSA